MNRRDASRALAFIPLAMATGLFGAERAFAQPPQQGRFPRLDAAITAINDAVDFLQKAPDDFGGHKAAAIRACQAAGRQLNQAINYRERHR